MTTHQLADRCMAKVRYTLRACPKPLRGYLEQFLEQIEPLVLTYLQEATKSDRKSIAAQLESAGHLEAAMMVRGQP